MSHQVLARKWRPSGFAELVGQEHVLKALVNALDRDRLHHAYLFTGTRGVGKTTIARIFAKCLNCEQGVSSQPCGTCSACVEIAEGRFIDLIEVDAASRTKVEDTRELLENVQYAPSRGRYKVYLIDEVHMLSNHSFNALLKTLEEPPPHVKFLLATTDPQKLPATVLSRCLQFNLKNMAADRIVKHLEHVLGAEQVQYDEAALWLLAEAARGSMRDALSLTDQAIGYGAGNVLEQEVAAMLGTIDRQAVSGVIAAVIAGEGAALFAQIEHLAELGTDFQTLLDEVISLLHMIAVAQAVPEVVARQRVDTSRIAEFAQAISGEDVQIFYQMALNARRDFAYVPDPRRGFEMLALRLLAFRPVAGSEIELLGEQDDSPGSASQQPRVDAGVPGAKKPDATTAGDAGEMVASGGNAGKLLDATMPAVAEPAQTAAQALSPDNQHPLDRPTHAPLNSPGAGPAGQAGARTDSQSGIALAGGGGITLAQLTPQHWLGLFGALNLTGVTRSVVSNMQLQAVDGAALHFVLDEQQGGLYNDTHRQRLQNALDEYFTEAVEVAVDEGALQGESPALSAIRCKAERLERALEELQQDRNVQLLVNEFDGRLDTGTVQPID